MLKHAAMLQTIRDAGHRLTPQREIVLGVIDSNDSHLTAEEIIDRVREHYPYLNKTAVYRSLDLLTELGLVTRTDLGRGRIEYELHRHPHHHHLVCRNCHQLTEIGHDAFASLAKKIENEYGFKADMDHFAVFGLCSKCKTNNLKKSIHPHS